MLSQKSQVSKHKIPGMPLAYELLAKKSPKAPKTIEAINSYCYSPELKDKTLLLKSPHDSDTEHREINVGVC